MAIFSPQKYYNNRIYGTGDTLLKVVGLTEDKRLKFEKVEKEIIKKKESSRTIWYDVWWNVDEGEVYYYRSKWFTVKNDEIEYIDYQKALEILKEKFGIIRTKYYQEMYISLFNEDEKRNFNKVKEFFLGEIGDLKNIVNIRKVFFTLCNKEVYYILRNGEVFEYLYKIFSYITSNEEKDLIDTLKKHIKDGKVNEFFKKNVCKEIENCDNCEEENIILNFEKGFLKILFFDLDQKIQEIKEANIDKNFVKFVYEIIIKDFKDENKCIDVYKEDEDIFLLIERKIVDYLEYKYKKLVENLHNLHDEPYFIPNKIKQIKKINPELGRVFEEGHFWNENIYKDNKIFINGQEFYLTDKEVEILES